MDEQRIQVFIDSVKSFFMQQTGTDAEVGTPFLSEVKSQLGLGFTGIIGISGQYRGCVYYSAPAELLREVLLRMGETDGTTANLCDLAGEIANTVAGNARRDFGKDFMISVPVVVHGGSEQISLPADLRAVVVPLKWRKHQSVLVVAISSA